MARTDKPQTHRKLYENIKVLLHEARNAVARNINTAMVMTYFEIGRMIVVDEQEGAKRAEYAKETLKSLSHMLTGEFGRGFSVDNLELMRKFYLVYSKSETLTLKSQMQMYVNYYDRYVKAEDENKTIGIILCKDKKKALVEITLPENNEQIFARKYQLYLPSKEELKRQLEE